MAEITVLAQFDRLEETLEAIRQLRERGYRDLTVFSPLPDHTLIEALDDRPSPVRLFTLIGGLLGCAAGFYITIAMSLDWPLIVGGKPIVSLPPFVIIAFELTILFGGLATLLGWMIFARLPRPRLARGYDIRYTEDRFGISVSCSAEQVEELVGLVQQLGAVEVRREAA